MIMRLVVFLKNKGEPWARERQALLEDLIQEVISSRFDHWFVNRVSVTQDISSSSRNCPSLFNHLTFRHVCLKWCGFWKPWASLNINWYLWLLSDIKRDEIRLLRTYILHNERRVFISKIVLLFQNIYIHILNNSLLVTLTNKEKEPCKTS